MKLAGKILECCEIWCSKCHSNEIEYTSDIEKADELFSKNGWDVIDNRVLCPECTKAGLTDRAEG